MRKGQVPSPLHLAPHSRTRYGCCISMNQVRDCLHRSLQVPNRLREMEKASQWPGWGWKPDNGKRDAGNTKPHVLVGRCRVWCGWHSAWHVINTRKMVELQRQDCQCWRRSQIRNTWMFRNKLIYLNSTQPQGLYDLLSTSDFGFFYKQLPRRIPSGAPTGRKMRLVNASYQHGSQVPGKFREGFEKQNNNKSVA